jgi:hypothetical protein
MKFNVEVKSIVHLANRRVVQSHDIRKGHLPEIVVPHEQHLQGFGEIVQFSVAEARKAGVCAFRRDVTFISVAGKVRQKRDRGTVFENDPAAIGALGIEDVLEQNASCFFMVAAAGTSFRFNCFENEVGRVNLAVRVRIRYADDLAFVFENQDVLDFRP